MPPAQPVAGRESQPVAHSRSNPDVAHTRPDERAPKSNDGGVQERSATFLDVRVLIP
jgi:hypothetical protein